MSIINSSSTQTYKTLVKPESLPKTQYATTLSNKLLAWFPAEVDPGSRFASRAPTRGKTAQSQTTSKMLTSHHHHPLVNEDTSIHHPPRIWLTSASAAVDAKEITFPESRDMPPPGIVPNISPNSISRRCCMPIP